MQRVTHRQIGDIPGCIPAGPVTCPVFDESAYWTGVQRYRRAIYDYIAHMNDVRAGLVPEAA